MRQNIIKLVRADYAELKWSIFVFILVVILIANGILLFDCLGIKDQSFCVDTCDYSSIEQMKQIVFNDTTWRIERMVCFIIAWAFLSLFSDYFNKKKAVQIVMLPAAKKEKFCYIMARNALFVPLSLMVIIYVNNTIWSLALGVDYRFMNFERVAIGNVNLFLSIAAFLSFFIYSSIYFKRHQFVSVLLVAIICGALHESQLFYNDSYITTILLLLFVIGMLYSVWWKYKNLQIK